LKTQKMAELKAEFVEYDQRIEELEKIEHPKPLREFIYTTFNAFADVHPWVEQENIQPKSIAREMVEQIASFNEYVKEYGLERSEGVLLRQLSQTYKILVQTVPESFKTQEVWDIQVGIRTLLGRVDSSLVDEWEKMFKPQEQKDAKIVSAPVLFYAPDTNPKPFIARVRSDMFAFIAALGRGNYEDAAAILRPSSTETWSAEKLHQAFDPFYDEHERLIIDPRARAGELSQIQKSDDNLWRVRQTLLDPEEANDWFVEAEVHVDASLTPETPVLQLVSIGK
jgi:hypothetical protein